MKATLVFEIGFGCHFQSAYTQLLRIQLHNGHVRILPWRIALPVFTWILYFRSSFLTNQRTHLSDMNGFNQAFRKLHYKCNKLNHKCIDSAQKSAEEPHDELIRESDSSCSSGASAWVKRAQIIINLHDPSFYTHYVHPYSYDSAIHDAPMSVPMDAYFLWDLGSLHLHL